MRKLTLLLFCILLMGITSGCGSNCDWSIDPEEGLEAVDLDSLAYWYEGPSIALVYQASRGYQSFVVNYRLRPYTQEEGALDLARAVRFVRKETEVYGIDENDIAVMGFSAGGILAGEMLLNFDGLVNGTALDAAYIPDALDEVSADAAADGMIYSFYGRLSVGSTDVEMLRSGNLPPTF